jgi:ribonucleoside-diphosphate reductase alpha chain
MNFLLNPFESNRRYFANPIAEFVYYSKYSRWQDRLGRREVWEETVRRAVDYLKFLSDNQLSGEDYQRIHTAILQMEVMPSMRLLAMAGKAAKRNPISIFNCSFSPIDSIDAFAEMMYLSMNGVGVGFSVEHRFIDKLPLVQKQQVFPRGNRVYTVPDSTEGWCNAFKSGLGVWFNGADIEFDFSEIRPAGAVLKTKGGTASGPAPLKELFSFARNLILSRQGKKLSSVDVYDIVCKIADCVVMGGVRRSAAICLFDMNDKEMLGVKNGEYWKDAPWRANANNSAVWERRLTREEIDVFFDTMHDGYNGEPGFFSRYAVAKNLPGRRNKEDIYGVNPCGEAILRAGRGDGGGLCNLSSVVARADDTVSSLCDKMEVAAIIGTIQSMATDFKYLRPGWKRNAEEERLLGVDLTGHFDSETARSATNQIAFRSVVIRTNREYAKKLGINESAATTLVKPSGNSGLLLNVSSGVHPRWSEFYQRNVRVNVNDPLFDVLKHSGIDMVQESDTTYVVGFAVRSPDGATTRHDLGAIEHLEYWKKVKDCYAEHSVSMTCYYTDNELDDVKQWVYENQDIAVGIAFLPRSDARYENAPYVEIEEGVYQQMVADEPYVNYGMLAEIEQEDHTESSQELSCVAGQCDMAM